MHKCHYCYKEVKENKRGEIRMAFIPETGMTVDFPICDNWCLKRLRLERGYDKPRSKRQKDFVMGLLIKEKKVFLKNINKKINELKNE